VAGQSTNDRAGRPGVFTVTQLNQRARQLLERQFARVAVVGEISSLKTVSGHTYLSLKDDQSQLPGVLFRRDAQHLTFELRPGVEVLATGRLTIYPAYGRYQIIIDRLERRGAGALQAAFEELKAKLSAQGLFAQERKRPLPRIPRRVAVVTSPTGAVIRDIVNVATRRYPQASILVVPTRVQGTQAAGLIRAALERASRLATDLDLSAIIVARGGGSLEELSGFNDEAVARAVAAAPVPVVSAIGHETDFTISDFVADVRAPTPSAAAELVFPIRSELLAELRQALDRASRAFRRDVAARRHRLRAARATLGDSRSLMAIQAQRLDYVKMGVLASMERFVSSRRRELAGFETRLAHVDPRAGLGRTRSELEAVRQRLERSTQQKVVRARDRLQGLQQRLHALSPLGVLERGYAIALAPDGTVVRDAKRLRAGERVDVRVARGRFGAVVDTVEAGD
jgi:exodeoxyribonuclease VII large subunit